VKSPEEATMEVELYFEALIHKHKKFRFDCELGSNLSLDPGQDKLLKVSRRVKQVNEDIAEAKSSQEQMLDKFDALDETIH